MQKQDFYFDLPKALIAHYPMPERTASRLLQLNGQSGVLKDSGFTSVLDHINPGDLLVFNNTRVIPARLYGQKSTGGKVEVLIERLCNDTDVVAQMRSSKPLKPDTCIQLLKHNGELSDYQLKVTGREGSFYTASFVGASAAEVMQITGHMPLPPYIERSDEQDDFERYQTVYAEQPGAVAAPTAGLHFSDELLKKIQDKGASFAYVTLHVGAGTFQPLRVDDIKDHVMHKEWLELNPKVCQQVNETVKNGGKVIAVGTTAVRCLETAARTGELKPYQGDTQLFITPGYRFNVVDSLITNFHLPESTLIMLVSAFAGIDHTMNAYQHAIAQEYRFFSYGDAMYISGQHPSYLRSQYV